ncbi:hypothetical protein JL101_028045 [Skermanella rosea]|uniref:hypothetical protein n=1 Tax=Skermanella rosea TaxID=1817965 RepID=UPI001E2A5A6D|nr:hypothetical protein [Skermanella rosea]UEM03754.1 hypothetical protein JL101_028045 [Skermanella rosea]
MRLNKVDSALKGTRISNPAIQRALADYEIVVGSYYGELTSNLERFLREFEKSGLVTAMAEQQGCSVLPVARLTRAQRVLAGCEAA